MRLHWVTRIDAVEKRTKVNSAHKEGDELILDKEDLGWFIVLKEFGIAFWVGNSEPDFKAGQNVRIMVEGI